MEKRLVWRYRAQGPEGMVVEAELVQQGDDLFYRRLFNDEVVVEKQVSPEQAGQLWAGLVAQGWHSE